MGGCLTPGVLSLPLWPLAGWFGAIGWGHSLPGAGVTPASLLRAAPPGWPQQGGRGRGRGVTRLPAPPRSLPPGTCGGAPLLRPPPTSTGRGTPGCAPRGARGGEPRVEVYFPTAADSPSGCGGRGGTGRRPRPARDPDPDPTPRAARFGGARSARRGSRPVPPPGLSLPAAPGAQRRELTGRGRRPGVRGAAELGPMGRGRRTAAPRAPHGSARPVRRGLGLRRRRGWAPGKGRRRPAPPRPPPRGEPARAGAEPEGSPGAPSGVFRGSPAL